MKAVRGQKHPSEAENGTKELIYLKKILVKVTQQPQKPPYVSNKIWAMTSGKKDKSQWPPRLLNRPSQFVLRSTMSRDEGQIGLVYSRINAILFCCCRNNIVEVLISSVNSFTNLITWLFQVGGLLNTKCWWIHDVQVCTSLEMDGTLHPNSFLEIAT